MRFLWLCALAACGGGGSATVVEVPPQEVAPSPQPTDPVVQPVQPVAVDALPMHSHELWAGTYVCAQGRTDLVLHVDRVSGGTIDAVFEFSHSPSGAGGAYRMSGSIDGDGTVQLTPGQWLDQPSGYVSVGMHGSVRGDAFRGRMDHPTCSTFALRRR